MIFLKDNVLLEKDLIFEDIKPRLLGMQLADSTQRQLTQIRALGELSHSEK